MEPRKKIAVAGATGRAGRHVAEALAADGHEVVPMSRATGVDLVTGAGLDAALAGADVIVDAATGPSPDEAAATEFFAAAARNLLAAGERAGVGRIVVVSIIGCDRFSSGYNAAKVAHEAALLAGPIPVSVLRAAQFHEFVGELMAWGTRGDVSYVPRMRTQLVAASTVGRALADLATAPGAPDGRIRELAGPREERLDEMARLLAERRGDAVRVEGVLDPSDADHALYEAGAALPGPDATLAGPTFAEWLDR